MTLTAAQPLVAAAPALVETQEQLSSGNLATLYEAAVDIWESNGLPQELADRLRSVQFVFADLPDRTLAASAGLNIVVDHNAAGHGWFVDQTPELDEEFSATANDNALTSIAGTLADGRIDLLTVILHEQAHILGLDHTNDEETAALMFATLATGTRRKLDPSVVDAILANNGWIEELA